MKKVISLFLIIGIIFSFQRYNSFAENDLSDYNYEDAKLLIESHDVISFDIFDTLLVRPYAKPRDLFKHLQLLQDECGFTKKMPRGKGSALEKIILQPHSENVELFNYAKSLGKKVIIVSDMYLHEKFLSKVLKKNGIKGWDKLYVSSDYQASKNSGKLFDVVLKDLKVKPQKILHIGDNLHSDCKMAKTRGIDYFYTPKLLDRLFTQEPRMKKFYKKNKNDLTASIMLGLSKLNLLHHDEDFLYNLGYIYAGPLCYLFVNWLQDEFKKDCIEEALFVARDGYTLQKAFDIIKGKDCKVNTHYAYIPRRQYALCSLDVERYGKINPSILRYVLEYYKDKNDFLSLNTPDLTDLEECKKFFNNNIEIYKTLAEHEKLEYKSYLDEFKLGNKRVAIIDLDSFEGTSFKFLNMFLDHKNVFGYLFWGNEKTESMGINQMLSSLRQGEKIEPFFTAPEKSTYKVTSKEKITVGQKGDLIKNYPRICRGILDFVKDAEISFHGIKLSYDEKVIKSFINNIYDYPSKKDIDMIPELENTMNYLSLRWGNAVN